MTKQKTWTELLGKPQAGTRYEVYDRDIVATQDGKHYRVIWRFEIAQHARVVLEIWFREQQRAHAQVTA